MTTKEVRVKCEAGHVSTVEASKKGDPCSFSVASALMPGTQTPCRLPVVELLPSADAETTPEGNQLVTWAMGMVSDCAICKRTFVQGETVAVVPIDDKVTHHVHDGCFYKTRADMYQQLFAQAHQTCAFLLAARGNRARVSKSDIERAHKLNCNFKVSPTPTGGLDIAFVEARIR